MKLSPLLTFLGFLVFIAFLLYMVLIYKRKEGFEPDALTPGKKDDPCKADNDCISRMCYKKACL
jgi:hypothetical protein